MRSERTFWEKATILHQFHFQHDPDRVGDRLSRHYYDVVQLTRKGIADRAIREIELLQEVADHKHVYYPQNSARYDLAREPATLKLVPNDDIRAALASDYDAMSEMFFVEPPSFDEILIDLTRLESRINQHS